MVPRREPPTEQDRDIIIGRRALKGAAGGGFRKVAPVREEPPAKAASGGGRKWVRIEAEADITAHGHPYLSFDPDGTY